MRCGRRTFPFRRQTADRRHNVGLPGTHHGELQRAQPRKMQLVPRAGFEPATYRLGGGRSIH